MPEGALFTGSPKAFFARIASAPQPLLSPCEEFLWWSARLAGDTTFNVRVVLRLRGPVDLPALEAGVVEIARRHETLRTVFPMDAGVVRRHLLPPAAARPVVTDLEPVEPAARDAEAWRLVLDESNRPFNLARGPLFRSSILRLGPEHHLLQLTIHHLVVDGGSVDILLRELGIVYGAYSRNEASPLPDVPVQYAEYAARGRRRLEGGGLERSLSYWKTQLAGTPSLLDLPTDGPRRTARHYPGHTLTFALDADRTRAIGRLARQHRTTPFVFLLGILQLLLYRLSGNPRVAVETPLGSRRSVEAEGLVGLLVDLVPLRSDLSGNPRLADLLSSLRRATFGAIDHAGVPIHVLVTALDANVDPSHSAICQVMFNLIDRRERAAYLELLHAEPVPLPESPHSKFDMMLTAHLTDALAFQLLYRRDLFSDARMEELVAQFTLLVDQALAAPETRIEEYSLVTPRAARLIDEAAAPTGGPARPGGAADRAAAFGTGLTAALSISPGSRVGVLPGTKRTAVVRAVLEALSSGGLVSVPAVETTDGLEHWLEGIAVAIGDPAAWRRVKKGAVTARSLRSALVVGGVPVREDVRRVRALAPAADCACLFGCEEHPEYLSLYRPRSDAREIRTIVPVGRGVANVELVVLNRAGELAGIGELGELHFRTPRSGERDEGGASTVATGLMGRFLPDGNVDRVGGPADWGSVDGYTVRFDEVAAALMRHPNVLDAIVGIERHGGDASLAAFIVPDELGCSADELEACAADHLPAYMVPKRFVRVEK